MKQKFDIETSGYRRELKITLFGVSGTLVDYSDNKWSMEMSPMGCYNWGLPLDEVLVKAAEALKATAERQEKRIMKELNKELKKASLL